MTTVTTLNGKPLVCFGGWNVAPVATSGCCPLEIQARQRQKRSRVLNALRLLISLSAVIASGDLVAKTYWLGAGGSGENQRAFFQETEWIDEVGITVRTVPSSGNDYVVDSGRVMGVNGQGVNRTFKGDSLRIGEVGGTAGTFMHCHENTITIGNFILANGMYRTWRAENDSVAHIAGRTRVLSPETEPFCIHPTHDAGAFSYVLYWDAAIDGERGTALRFSPHPNTRKDAAPIVILTGDNGTYYGKFEATADGSGMQLRIATDTALGGALDAFDANALCLSAGITLGTEAGSLTLSRALNRGIFIGDGGAAIDVGEGRRLHLAWPIAGSSALRKTGAGTLVLAAECAPELEVSDGIVILADGFSMGAESGLRVLAGGFVSVEAGVTNAVEAVEFAGGGIVVSCAEDSGASGVLALSEGLAENTCLPIRPCAVHDVNVPFLMVPSAKGNLTEANFTVIFDAERSDLPSARVEIHEEGGYSVAYLKTAALVTPTDGSVTQLFCSKHPERWSDGRLPHADADYRVVASAENAMEFNIDDKDSDDRTYLGDYVFPGGVLALSGYYKSSSNKKTLTFYNRPESITANLRIGSCVKIIAAGNKKPWSKYPSGDRHVLRGTMHLDTAEPTGWEGVGLSLQGFNSRTTIVESVISGTGDISMRSVNATGCTMEFTGDNSFAGSWKVYHNRSDSSESADVVFRFRDERSLGSPTVGKAKTVGLFADGQSRIVLNPMRSTVINAANRTFFFNSGNIRVRVDGDNDFEIASTTRFGYSCVLEKVGLGTWTVSGDVTLSTTDRPLTVLEGFVRAKNVRAFAGLRLTVTDGAGFAAVYEPDSTSESATVGTLVTDASNFAVTGNVLAFKVLTNGARVTNRVCVPVLTVPLAAAEAVDSRRIVVVHDVEGREAVVVKDSVDIDSETFVRYSVSFLRGLTVIVR